jgi:hypothetical protein
MSNKLDARAAAAVLLRAGGWSYRRIADVLGISHEQVRRLLVSAGQRPPLRVVGLDGRSYPAEQPDPRRDEYAYRDEGAPPYRRPDVRDR